jgi:amino acid adenylation domain-containing protein
MFNQQIIIPKDGIECCWVYNTEVLDDDSLAKMSEQFSIFIKGIVADLTQPISRIPLLSETTLHKILVEWNDTKIDYLQDSCIHQLFEAQVKLAPEAVAVVFADQQLTYRELNVKANQLAHYLQSLGVGTETLVGICLERSIEMLIALLGILKAGGAYVPLDSNYPVERLAFMLEDTQVSILITHQSLVEKLPVQQAQILCLENDSDKINCQSEDNPTCNVTVNNLAYVTYTSGSTGRPKGVCVVHQGVVRLVKRVKYADLNSAEVFLQLAPISFDASTFEIWGCLLNGAKLVIMPPLVTSLAEIGQAIIGYQITILWLTAGLFHLMVDERLADLKSVSQLLAGGDVLSTAHIQKLLTHHPNIKLINGYGPTENTTFTCCYTIVDPQQITGSVPIGRPIANTQVYILDRYLSPVPIGVAGELYIGGDGLARGYLNRPDLTTEKFIANPFIENVTSHLYKTGDLVRYLPDGNIEFLGRLDNQVKIRGFRIETAEIEAVLNQHHLVQQCMVIAREDEPGNKRLVAYIVSTAPEAFDPKDLRRFLQQALPDYMLPSVFVPLEAFSLTSNGKIDRKALPKPVVDLQSSTTYVAPSTPIRQKLADIWADVLKVESVGINDDFFALGGDSLLALQTFAQIETVFQQKLPLSILLKAPTIDQLANILQDNNYADAWSPLVEIQVGDSAYPLFCIHGGGFNVLIYRTLAIGLGANQTVYGIQARGLDGSQPSNNSLEMVAADYIREIRRVQPTGPYFLSGLSNGGNIAYEMARQLRAEGEEIALLAMFDSYTMGAITLLPSLPRLVSSLHYLLMYGFPRLIQKSVQTELKTTWINLREKFQDFRSPASAAMNGPETTIESPEAIEIMNDSSPYPLKLRLKNGMDRISQYVLAHSPYSFFTPKTQLQKLDSSIATTLKQLEKSYAVVTDSDDLKPYSGKIILFRATETVPGFQRAADLGWGRIALGGVDVYHIPGHHISIMDSPVLAEQMKLCINQAIGLGKQ